MEREEIRAELTTFVDGRVKAVTGIDTTKTNVNAHPFYIGPVMVLSDQDGTALKHHALSSAVMGTVFVGFIATLSDPAIPLIGRIFLMGGILTGLQALLVAASNVLFSATELWEQRGRPMPWHLCARCIAKCWEWWLAAHTVKLANGVTIWVDEFGSVVLDDGEPQ